MSEKCQKSIRKNDWSSDEDNGPPLPTSKQSSITSSVDSGEKLVPKKFRMNCKNFFLTYPQCQTTKETALGRLKERFPDGKLLVCHEKHQSGDDHLHALVLLDKPLNIKDPAHFDFVGGKHGKYEPARNIRRSVEYITKKGEYVSEGIDVESILQKQAPKSSKIAKLILDGSTLDQINTEDPGFFMMNKRKIEEYASYCKVKKQKEDKQKWVEFSDEQLAGMNSSSKQVAQWINKNLFKTRPFKAKQLYIYGPPNLGKTTLVRWLENFATVYWMSIQEDFSDGFNEDFHDLIVIDEFRAQKRIQDLNQWLDGSTFTYKVKGRQGEKRKNLPMIILSNFSLEGAYSNSKDEKLDPLRVRLEIVELESMLNLFTIE